MIIQRLTNNKAIAIVLLVLLSACNGANKVQPNKVSEQEEIVAVKNTLIAMWDAIENEDIDAYAAFIHEDYTQFGETDPILRIGKAYEVSGVREWVATSTDIHTEMEEPIVTVNGNVAWIVYYWNDSGFTNGEAFSSRGKSTRIFVKENGKWLCAHGHYTLLP